MVKIKKAKDLNGDSFYFASHAQATFMDDGSTVQDQIEMLKDNQNTSLSPNLSNYVTTDQLNTALSSVQPLIEDLDVIRQGAEAGQKAIKPNQLSSVAFSNNYADLGNVPHIPTSVDIENWGFVNQDSVAELLDSKVDAVDGKVLSSNDFTDVLKTKLENLTNYDDSEIQLAVETLRESLDTLTKSDTSAAIESFNEIIKFLETIEDTDSLSGIIAGIEQQIANKANDSSVVHLSGNETITGAKTFNGRVNFLGSGDLNAMYLSTNTRLNVNGTTNTVLGFSSGTFLINNAAYNLILRGKDIRPIYNSTPIALTSDIPAAVTESTVSGWGFTKNTGTYSKPSTGIPKTDLASEVQTSLGKADTALQSYTEQYTGTVTGVKINGTTRSPSRGVVDLGTVITAHQTLKTINGESIVGSGNITISGGSSSGGSVAYSEVNHGTSDTTFTLTPNTFHVWDEVASLTLDLGSETSGVANEYLFQFNSGATATSLTLPDGIKWTGEEVPSIEANKIYQISILKGLGSVLEWDNTPTLIENKAILTDSAITFQYPVASELAIDIGMDTVTISAGEQSCQIMFPIPEMEIMSISPISDSTYYYTF